MITKTFEISIRDIDPRNHIIGTGPEDDDGLPAATSVDFVEAIKASDNGERYVFGEVTVRPDMVQYSYVSALRTDLAEARREVFENILEACKGLATMLCEETTTNE